LECQRRTGAVLSNQARFRLEQISFAGKTTAGTRMAESGNAMTYYFCPICGSTVFFFLDVRNDDKRSNTGTVIERNTLRVTPPSTNSRKREWP
jgi:hypothetical protein